MSTQEHPLDTGASSPGTRSNRIAERIASDETTRDFPGRFWGGLCLVVAPLAGIVATLLAIGIYSATSADFAKGMAEHRGRMLLATNLDVIGIALGAFAVLSVAHRITLTHRRLGIWGGVLTIIGLFGPAFFMGIYFGALQIAAKDPAATAKLLTDSQKLTGVINISGPALVAGFILLGVGARKAGLLGTARSVALAATLLLPFGFVFDVSPSATLGFVAMAIALVPIGLQDLRGSRAGHTPGVA
jgi:hypothetical protein